MNFRRVDTPASPEVQATSIIIPTTDVTISVDASPVRAAVIAGGLLAFRGVRG